MMIKSLFVVACALALASAAGIALAQDGCANFQSVAACASASSQPQPMLCTWDDQKGCGADVCQDFSDNQTCGSTAGCVWMPWSMGVRCFNAQLLCSALPVGSCPKYSFCTVRDQTHCGVVGVLGANTVTAECDISFPAWSIALLFVWLIIMIILGIIVALAMGKAKQQRNLEVEKDEDVVVDSLQIRDNFQLGDPLNQPDE